MRYYDVWVMRLLIIAGGASLLLAVGIPSLFCLNSFSGCCILGIVYLGYVDIRQCAERRKQYESEEE